MSDLYAHAWVRMTGYGLAVVPAGGFVGVAEHGAVPWVDVELAGSGKFARILPHEGGFKSRLDGATTGSVHEVVRIEALESPARWGVQTSRYRCDWPQGLRLRSTAFPADSCAFEFFTEDGIALWVQTPRLLPALREMGARDQALVEMDEGGAVPWVWFAYVLKGARWLQRHAVVDLGTEKVVLSLQCPEALRASALAAANAVVDSLAAR